MRIRQAKQEDAQTLGTLVFSSAPTALAATFNINHELCAISFLKTSLANADGQYGYANHWLAEIDKQVVGCICAWHSDLADSFHQATLTKLRDFYGLAHTLVVVKTSLALQDCIPKPEQHEWCIGHFAVSQQYQRQGVGTALLELMYKQALNAGKLALSLDVESSNKQAIDFYLKQGFVVKSESGVSSNMQTLGIVAYLHLSKTLV